MHYCRDLESPDLYLIWNYYYMIASCLGRKIWLGNDWKIFPNLFIVFVGPPGLGKSLPATKCTDILKSLVDLVKDEKSGQLVEKPLIKCAPDSVTLEALWIEMANSIETIKICDNPPRFYAHSSVSFCLGDEMGILFTEKTADLMTFLNYAWDCRAFFHRKTKSHGEVSIHNICVNLLGCATHDWVKRTFQSAIINEGLSSRALFINGEHPRQRTTTLKTDADQRESMLAIQKHLRIISKLHPTEIKFDEHTDAWQWFDRWVKNKYDKHINRDKKLVHYYARKRVHLLKMAMVCHFAEKTTLSLEVEDFEKAEHILELTEVEMHHALASNIRNPIYELSQEILNSVTKSGSLSSNVILLRHFDGGNQDDIGKALDFLRTTNQITPFDKDGKTCYSVNKISEMVNGNEIVPNITAVEETVAVEEQQPILKVL